jgi:hypothetical protein
LKPVNYSFINSGDDYTFTLYHVVGKPSSHTGDGRIGNINISKQGNKVIVHYAEIVKKLRGKGYGVLLYEAPLTYFNTLTSYYHTASIQAQGVWQKLIKKYDYSCDFFEGELTVYNSLLKKKQIVRTKN